MRSFLLKCTSIALCLFFLTACNHIFAAPTATSTPAPSGPPVATIEINGQTQNAGIGSYCWSGDQGQQICDSMTGIPTAYDPLVTDSPFVGHFHLPLNYPPESLSLSMMAVTSSDDMTSGVSETHLWKITSGWRGGLPLKDNVSITSSWTARVFMLSNSTPTGKTGATLSMDSWCRLAQ